MIAPVDGVIFERRVEPGERIGSDMENEGAMFALFDPAMVQVRCDVPLADAGSVLPGQLAEVTVDAFKGRTFRGTVLVGGFRADIAKNTLQVKIGLDDADGLLRPDTLTRVRIMVPGSSGGSARTQVVVPADWVVRDGSRSTVLVMDAGFLRRVDLGEATMGGSSPQTGSAQARCSCIHRMPRCLTARASLPRRKRHEPHRVPIALQGLPARR